MSVAARASVAFISSYGKRLHMVMGTLSSAERSGSGPEGCGFIWLQVVRAGSMSVAARASVAFIRSYGKRLHMVMGTMLRLTPRWCKYSRSFACHLVQVVLGLNQTGLLKSILSERVILC